MEKKPEKKVVPGANYPETKTSKISRRKKKPTAENESTEAGPSSTVPPPSPARQTTQTASQPVLATTSTNPSIQSSAQTSTRQAAQASSQSGQPILSNKPATTPGPPGPPEGLRNRGLSGLTNPKDTASTSVQPEEIRHDGNQSKDNSSNASHRKQEVARLKGQPSRPTSVPTRLRTINLKSNYFPLVPKPGIIFHRYEIIVHPEAKGRKLTQIIKTALNHGEYKALKHEIVTDFSTIMLAVVEIPLRCTNFMVSYQSEIETQASNNAKEYRISLVGNGTVDLSKPEIYLRTTESSSNGLAIEQALDIVLGHHRKLSDDISIVNKRKAFSINRGHRHAYDGTPFGDGGILTALRGYFSSVRMSESNILVNINVSHGAFYEAGKPLWEVIQWLGNLRSVDRSKVSGLLRGLQVSSSHIRRVWSIWGFPKDGDGRGFMLHPPKLHAPGMPFYTPAQVSFFYDEKPEGSSTGQAQTLSDQDKQNAEKGKLRPHGHPCSCPGRWLTVAEYFETVRGEPISTQNLMLPVINVGSNKRPTYLPSHVCQVRPGQISRLKLDPGQMIEMGRFAVRNPDENAKSISNKGFKTLGLTPDNKELKRFSLEVSNDMIRLNGRMLQQPKLFYSGDTKIDLRASSWSLQGIKFRNPRELNKWACLRIQVDNADGSIWEEPLKNSLSVFQQHLRSKGIIAKATEDHGDLRIRGIDFEGLGNFFKSSRDDYGVRFLLVVLPRTPTPELYRQIKRYGDVIHGIHTVCVKANRLGTLPYDDNVALKINLKLQGTNHVLDNTSYGFIRKESTMVVGIDVTHPPPGDDGSPSVAAVVASRDAYLSQWPADLRINNSREEMVGMLREMLITRLKHYQEFNDNSLPRNILIYRDGVGEGQYAIVLDTELPRLRAACQQVYGDEYDEGVFPRISLIVVGKRHHTRFYRIDDRGYFLTQKQGNPPCGTLVDDGITQDRNWDFFLQSHTALTGTARPAHYFVLLDEIFRQTSNDPVGDLERITYSLCYLYGKATTSVSIPPPVYYADKACDRGRRYLGGEFDQGQKRSGKVNVNDVKVHDYIKDTMFYI